MGFLEAVGAAKAHLHEHGRVSLRALKREFDLDDDALEELVEELVEVQRVAVRDEGALEWAGSTPDQPPCTTSEAGMAPPEPAPEAERRQLTVLFCDLVDSTRLAAGLDPEDWREVLRGYQERAGRIIERFEGHVAQYLGDGLLVYFGWPRAHEEDAERAVRAGLGIVEAVGKGNDELEAKHAVRLAVRIGIHTGPVVVGEMGRAERRETLALGDTTNRAARLEGIAAPSTVVISAETLQLVRGIFVTEDLGPQRLKGVAEPVVAHRVRQPSGVRSRLDLAQGRLTPFVGREQEFGLLVERWEQVLEGQGQTVLITGDAGIGKSRLALRLREFLVDQPHSWLESRTWPHGMASPLQPTIELVRQGLVIADEDTPEMKLEKIEGAMERARLGDEAVSLLAALLGVPLGDAPSLRMSAELQREKTLDLLVSWLLALGDLQPLLLLNEDLHWADPTSIELLGRIMDQVPTAKVMLLLTARPPFEVPWSQPKNLTPIALGPLRPRQATAMVNTLSDRRLPSATLEQIVERSDGVPLYLEEVTRNLVEAGGADQTTVPETLQDSLTARLDRLSAAREVAQIASLLGREFSYRLLAAAWLGEETALQDGLQRLVEASVLFQRGSPPDASFTFKHALIQDTAAASLLKRRSRELHERIGRLFEEQFPDAAAERPEEVARHFEAAGLPEPALVHYRRAGDLAESRWAHVEAITHFRRALDLLPELPPGPERDQHKFLLLVALGVSWASTEGYGGAELERIYGRALELARYAAPSPELVSALYGLARLYGNRADFGISEELSRRLLSLAEQQPEAALLGRVMLGMNHFFRGEFVAALSDNEQVRTLRDLQRGLSWASLYTADQGINSIVFEALSLAPLGHLDRARQRCLEAIREAKSQGHPLTLAWVLSMCGFCGSFLHDWEGIYALSEETMSVSAEIGSRTHLAAGKLACGGARACGRSDPGGLDQIREGLRELMKAGSGGVATPVALWLLSQALLASGCTEEALGVADGGLAHSREKGSHLMDAALHRLRGEGLLLLGRMEQAEAELLRSIEVAASQEAKLYELRSANSLARLWRDQSKRAEARALLQPVYDWFTEGFDTKDLKDAKALLEELA